MLGFLAQPAAVVTQLQLGPGGALQVSAEQLQQLLSEAAELPAEGPSAAQSVWDITGYRVVYAAVFEPRTLGQSGAAMCAVQEADKAGSTGSQVQQQLRACPPTCACAAAVLQRVCAAAWRQPDPPKPWGRQLWCVGQPAAAVPSVGRTPEGCRVW